jgi:phosphoribosylanthranilate isomerase
MIIKVSGLREAEQIRALTTAGVDMLAFDFRPESNRFVQMISSRAGIIPDYSEQRLRRYRGYENTHGNEGTGVQGDGNSMSAEGNLAPRTSRPAPQKVGVFADDMPQNIIMRIYNYELDAVQLDGNESAVMTDNRRSSAVPDICSHLIIIKTLHIHEAADMNGWKAYEGHADLLRFEMEGKHNVQQLLDSYDGTIPFLLSCGIDPDDVSFIRQLCHPLMAGIDLNEGFETAPAVKDMVALMTFQQNLF